MTTGRINQVTIARRHSPLGAARLRRPLGPPERFGYLLERPGRRWPDEPALRSLTGICDPTPSSPEENGRVHQRRGVSQRLGTTRTPRGWGTGSGGSPVRDPPSRLPPDATVIGIASGQPPTEPIRRRPRAQGPGRRRASTHTSADQVRWGTVLGGAREGDHPAETPIARRTKTLLELHRGPP